MTTLNNLKIIKIAVLLPIVEIIYTLSSVLEVAYNSCITEFPGHISKIYYTLHILTGLSAPPQNITVMVISSTSLTVLWDPPPLADQNGVTGYQVRINTVGHNSNIVNVVDTSYIAVGLDEFQEYDIEVASVSPLGIGPFSTPLRAQTLEDGTLYVVM